MTSIQLIIDDLEDFRRAIDTAITELREVASPVNNTTNANGTTDLPRKRPKLSPAARRRISEAQKARWAAVRKGPKRATAAG